MKALDLIDKRNAMARDKDPYKPLWQEISELMAPNKADYSRVFGIGQKRHRRVWDGTSIHAADIFASSVLGITANPAARWFTLATLDDDINKDQEASEWLDLWGKLTMANINQPQAKFYAQMKNTIRTDGVMGTACLSVQRGTNTTFQFQPIPLGFLDIATDYGGNVDTKYITRHYNARQLKQMRDEKRKERQDFTLHDKVEKAKDDEKFEIIHAVFPRKETKKGMFGAINMPIASVWVDVTNQHIMLEWGFEEDAVLVGRWDIAGEEAWGRGQGEVVLADTKLVNMAERGLMVAMDKQLNPTLQVPSDGTYGNLDLSAGAVNAIMNKDGKGAQILESNGNLPIVMEWLEAKRNAIRVGFFVDQLQMISNTARTATEVLRQLDEKSRLIAPNIGMIQSEIIGPTVERCAKLLLRTPGAVPPPPPILANQEMKVVYVSPLSRAQRENEALAILQFIQNMAGIAQISPETRYKVDFNAAVDELHEITGIPPKIMRSEEEFQEIMQSQAQAAQAQAQMSSMQQAADVAKTANEAGLVSGQ